MNIPLFRLTENLLHPQSMRSRVPGKIILSGEHAVLYNQPALAIAVNRFATCEVFQNGSDRLEIMLNGEQLDRAPMVFLPQEREMTTKRFESFKAGRLPIEQVIRGPKALISYAVTTFALAENISLKEGLLLNIRSEIPIGCGMGSSAAVILAVYKALCLAFDVTWSTEHLYEAALQTENLQHGKSSGLDPLTCLHGGAVLLKGDQTSSVEVEGLEFQLVFTGKPECTTGECVSHVAEHFATSTIWKLFGNVTNQFVEAIETGNLDNMRTAVTENQRLLEKIGVVPNRVQKFIEEIEFHDSAAKVCGAGAISGDAGGMVLVLSDMDLEPLTQHYGYECMKAEVDNHGAQTV